jgi:putative transposase
MRNDAASCCCGWRTWASRTRFALLRLLPGGDRDKDVEILSLRHQLAVLQRQLDGQQVRFEPVDRAWRAALLYPLPRPTLRRLRLLVRPDMVLRWHRDLIARRHAAMSRPRRRGRPRTLRSIRAVVLRLARENGNWGYRRVHGELLTLGIKIAASTVWAILREAGIDPAPDRAATTWTTSCAPRLMRCWPRTHRDGDVDEHAA